MAKYSPQSNFFETSQKFMKFYDYSYWIIFVASLIATAISMSSWINYLSVFALVYLSVLGGVSQDFKLKAEKLRRKDFIDNSFGTRLIHDSSEAYYDNDEIEFGIRKSLINLFQNTFFSYNISRRMFRKRLTINLLFIIAILFLAIYGLSKNQFSLPILHLFLSKYFLLDLINSYRFMNGVEECFDTIKDISRVVSNDTKLTEYEIKFFKVLIDYEVLLAESNIKLDSKIFKKLNTPLTEEWNILKEKYTEENKNEC